LTDALTFKTHSVETLSPCSFFLSNESQGTLRRHNSLSAIIPLSLFQSLTDYNKRETQDGRRSRVFGMLRVLWRAPPAANAHRRPSAQG